MFRYNLLCDNCNWEFTGFAVPGTVSAKPTKKARKNPAETSRTRVEAPVENEGTSETGETEEYNETTGTSGETGTAAKKKRVKIKL